nr:PKD-like domain-containing protein [uncultured Draconibacterium sp.]
MKKTTCLKLFFYLGIFFWLLASCSDDDEQPVDYGAPEIEFSAPEYAVKAGKQIMLKASVSGALNPIYSWKLDGVIVSIDTVFTYEAEAIGEYFLTFRVDAENGSLEKQVKLTVNGKMSPEITMPTTFGGYVGQNLEIAPTSVLYSDDATYVWKLDGKVISADNSCVINKNAVGNYTLTLKVTNEDGVDYVSVTVYILPKQTPGIFFDNGSYRSEGNLAEIRRFSVPLGRSLVMAPVISNMGENLTFTWELDGAVQSSTSEYFTFTPTEKGTYTVSVSANDGTTNASTSATVECVDEEGTYYRPASEASVALMNHIYEFVPAPGQFIDYQAGTTIQGVLDELNANNAVAMIGAYGGYYIVGFDHSVENSEGPDLFIEGNAFEGWSEPGIVWVMQDENGDGLPNDTWYELAGSEANSSDTKKRYAITYYRPGGPEENVLWSDNIGNINSVDYNGYHGQDYYYPMFMGDSYTLVGTLLGSTMDIGELETSGGYDWGYVDNYGTTGENDAFEIDNAIQADGTSVSLNYIDFVKVHTAMIGKGASVGEISTEAGSPYDYHLK